MKIGPREEMAKSNAKKLDKERVRCRLAVERGYTRTYLTVGSGPMTPRNLLSQQLDVMIYYPYVQYSSFFFRRKDHGIHS